MTNVRDGNPIDWSIKGVPLAWEAYAHEGGVVVIYDPRADKHVAIEIVGMTKREIDRAVKVAVRMLGYTPPRVLNG